MGRVPQRIAMRIQKAYDEQATKLNLYAIQKGLSLNEFPRKILESTWLRELDLRSHRIRTIPPGITLLKDLCWLDLRGNPLEYVPDIYGLVLDWDQWQKLKKKLSVKNITGLAITGKPSKVVNNILEQEELARFRNLRLLDLGSNALSSISESIGHLPNLTTLILSSNDLSYLPETIGNLKNLALLDSSHNLIEAIPKSIHLLQNLTALIFTGNKLSSLPEFIVELPNLKKLDVENNSLKTPPQEIANEGLESIRNYFHNPGVITQERDKHQEDNPVQHLNVPDDDIANILKEVKTPDEMITDLNNKVVEVIDYLIEREVRNIFLFSAGIILAVWGLLVFLTWEIGWDIMEPWTYFVGSGIVLIQYLFFVFSSQQITVKSIKKWLIEEKRKKYFEKFNI